MTMSDTQLREVIAGAWLELNERDDRTSPEDYPEMCLINHEEFVEFMERAALSKLTPPVDPDIEEAWAAWLAKYLGLMRGSASTRSFSAAEMRCAFEGGMQRGRELGA